MDFHHINLTTCWAYQAGLINVANAPSLMLIVSQSKTMKTKLLYVEHKSGYSDDGPAWIGTGTYSKSGRTIYFNGQAYQSMKGAGIGANYYNLETAEEFWISGVKKDETNRHWAGYGSIQIDRDVIEEFLTLTGKKELNTNEYEIVELSKDDIKSRIYEGQNQTHRRRE